MADAYLRRVASLQPIPDPGGTVEWTTVIDTISDLLPALRDAGAVAGFENNKSSGITGDPNKWVENMHRFSHIRVKNLNRHFLSDEDWTLITNILMPCLRALRLDDLKDEFWYKGHLGGRHVCDMDWKRGRGLHYFAPLECFATALVRLELRGADDKEDEKVVHLHVPSLGLDKLTSLRHLKLANFKFCTDDDLKSIGSCKRLHHLVFECCGWGMEDAEEKLSSYLKSMTNLMSFTSIGTTGYRTSSYEPQPRKFCIESKRLHQHRQNWEDLNFLPDLPDSVEEIDASCSASLGLERSMKPSIRGPLTQIPSSLRRISFAFCPFIENDTVELIGSSNNCQERLQQINLNGTSVTDVSPLLKCSALNVLEIRFSACSDPRLDQEWKDKQTKENSPLCIYWDPARTEKRKRDDKS